ncbi:hypothetical protein ILUMI_27046 [Ignelater luminosus]|uniref:RNA-directed DNA polymerase n=1 Tax=Ignelater luminosus TaxID=2038154 RepID=A0A8K0C507_IGNLU|nr:hypothetical protein ILUMI_27046 [Ignelater luminosus]
MLAEESINDSSLIQLLNGLKTGKAVANVERFGISQNEFSLQNNIICRGHRVVIPTKLRKQILQELHASHFGIVRMKALARSYCWWPRIDLDIENFCRNCVHCNKLQNNPVKAPLHPWEPAQKPFDRVHVDFAGPFMGTYYFTLIDAFTRWPEIHSVKNITTSTTINICNKIFSSFGLPQVLVSDNGKQFLSYEFKKQWYHT